MKELNYYYGRTPTMELEDLLTLIILRTNKPVWEVALINVQY